MITNQPINLFKVLAIGVLVVGCQPGEEAAAGTTKSTSEDDQSTIQEFLALPTGAFEKQDLVFEYDRPFAPCRANRGQVVLSCSRGVITVGSGLAAGTLASALTAVAIPTERRSKITKKAVFAKAGEVLGLASPASDWELCLAGLAQLGSELWTKQDHQGMVRGLQSFVLGMFETTSERQAIDKALAANQNQNKNDCLNHQGIARTATKRIEAKNASVSCVDTNSIPTGQTPHAPAKGIYPIQAI